MDHETPADDGVVPDEEAQEIERRFECLGELLRSARSVSAAVQWWTGEGPPEINVIAARDRVLTVPEYKALTGKHHSRGYERLGLLRTGGPGRQVVAWTRALVIPDRLPASVRMRLGVPHADNPVAALPTREPIGVVLGELGERAVRTNTTVTSLLGRQDAVGSELAYRCTGVWVVDGLPAVQAHEEILFNLVEDFAPPGRVEQLRRRLADRLAEDEPALPDGVCDLRVDQPC